MNKTLCYISKNKDLKSNIEDVIKGKGYQIKFIMPSDFMVEIWKHKPDMVIVDLDSIGEKGVISIESVIEDEYVPTLYVYEQYNPKWESLTQNGLLISYERCDLVIKDLINNSVITGRHYNQLSVNYETLKLMDEEFDVFLNAYMKSLSSNEASIIDEFLTVVYSENFLMKQTPKWYVMINQIDQDIEAWIYGKGIEDISYIKEENTDVSTFIEKAAEAGIYVNFSSQAMSDINAIDQIIPSTILSYFEKHFIGFDIDKVESLTTFGMKNTLYIGIDYVEQVNGYDLAIFKAVCDKINKLQLVKSNMVDLQESFIYTMDALARAAESKDDVTGHHIKRVNDYSSLIAKEIGMDDQFVNDIQIAAQMHDVGKISISELILNKPGKLSNEEFDEMKKHTTYGADIVGESNNLNMARLIAYYHHEKYDGSGYPLGLAGEDIPIAARIVSVADIYDALRSPRSYKEGFSHKLAYEIITVGDGRVMPEHFDPQVLEAFKRVHEVMKYIYDSNTD